MPATLQTFFEHYARTFNQALAGEVGMDSVAALYTPEFIAASPAGVRAGRNDAELQQAMAQGYAHYRAIGTTAMRLRAVRFTPLDDLHGVAHVAWTGCYRRAEQTDELAIDFDVHYFVRQHEGRWQVFGWVSGDEQALLRQHGIG